MKKNIFVFSIFSLILGFFPEFVRAESVDDLEVINLEGMYQTPKANTSVEIESSTESNLNTPTPVEVDQQVENVEPVIIQQQEEVKMNELKDLSRLSPFREVSVIQKKYLPKTERFQFYGAAGVTTNTPWFLNYGAKLGLAYHLTESFGLEISGLFLTSSEREVAQEIRENNGLRPEQFIYTKGYYGLDLIWSPIYGKLSNLEGGIIPFDMYFSVGGGTSNTNSKEKDVPTIHLATGQIFAINKAIAFRWDYSLNIFEATPISSSGTANPAKGSYTDLILTAGVSFFFPEASAR